MDWALAIAFDCDRPTASPIRMSLARSETVLIGRGDARAMTGSRVELPDRWASREHARLTREGDGWVLVDCGSKNGTWVDGQRIDRAKLGDGDVIEIGGTFLVLRRAPVGLEREPTRAGELASITPAFERELPLLAKVARSPVPILVRGESGSGKEVVARTVHALSGRRGPLVPINCGAIPHTLVEGELFGSKRGAFSGAEDRAGVIRSADGGTLFLDEVVELPTSSQAALLRFLQDGELTPLGADRRVRVDVRVVAATNQPIEDLIASGAFRHDLLARLRGYTLQVPPLRARIDDLGILIGTLLERLDPGGGRRISRSAARALFQHRWTANVRELEQSLRAAIAIAQGPELALEDLRLHDETPAAERNNDELTDLLEKYGGNISAVARDLDTSRTQVARLLARHGLRAEDFRRRIRG
ncbi:MAG: sigma 54-interacting transcriptional regulator [Kofleriaceae bacterium]